METSCWIPLLISILLIAGDQQVMNTLHQFLRNMPGSASESKFNKKALMDFDYSDDEEGGGGADFEATPQILDAIANLMTNERLLNKLKV